MARIPRLRTRQGGCLDSDSRVGRKTGGPRRVGRHGPFPAGGALSVLLEARALADGSGLVFPSARGRPPSEGAISMVRDLGIGAVPHGFRSSFRNWAAEGCDAPREVGEIALAHVTTDRLDAAYRRSDLFGRRSALSPAQGDRRHRLMDRPTMSPPSKEVVVELIRAWASAHEALWDALRERGSLVRIVAVTRSEADAAADVAVLETWRGKPAPAGSLSAADQQLLDEVKLADR